MHSSSLNFISCNQPHIANRTYLGFGPFLAVLRKIKLSQSVLLTCLLSLLLRPPLSVVLVVHPHLVSGSGQDHLVVVLAGVKCMYITDGVWHTVVIINI